MPRRKNPVKRSGLLVEQCEGGWGVFACEVPEGEGTITAFDLLERRPTEQLAERAARERLAGRAATAASPIYYSPEFED